MPPADSPRPWSTARLLEPWPLAAGLGVLAAALTLGAVPGVFTVDENNHLAAVLSLGEPGLVVPGTAGLPPSPELLWFDPVPRQRLGATRVTSTAPPLWSLVAWPVARLGWHGLVALQALSFAVAAWLVTRTAAAHARSAHTPWLALAAFAAGGTLLEYAQGVWPHALSVTLVLGGALLVAREREGRGLAAAAAAGVLLGVATGVRYQNLVPAAALGLALGVATRRPWAPLAYGAGLAGPLLASAALNHTRLGVFDPVTKGPGYRTLGGGEGGSRLLDALGATWARVVHFPAWPVPRASLHGLDQLYVRDPESGALTVLGVVKKALVQSSPWALLALGCVVAWPWLARRVPAERRLGLVSAAVVGSVLALFALYGSSRDDAFCFNQRYLLELLPFLALALAFSFDAVPLDRRAWWVAGLVALAAGALLLALLPRAPRRMALLYLPLLLGVALVVLRVLVRRGGRRALVGVGVALGACLGWSAAVHVQDDVAASRAVRRILAANAAPVAEALDARPTAVFAYRGFKNGVGPLLLDHDVVMADLWVDEGASAATLVAAFQAAGRRVLVVPTGLPPEVAARVFGQHRLRSVGPSEQPVVEIQPPG